MRIRSGAVLFLSFMVASMIGCQPKSEKATSTRLAIAKELTINATQTYQTVDGFGVNITPAQWRNGNLRPVIDSLVDDLGSTLIRFDCYGRADWLDPEKQNDDGTFPEKYLKEVIHLQYLKTPGRPFVTLIQKASNPSLTSAEVLILHGRMNIMANNSD